MLINVLPKIFLNAKTSPQKFILFYIQNQNITIVEFWRFAAILTWIIIGVIIALYLFTKRKWIWFGTNVLLGQRLHTSINKLVDEIAEKDIKRETLANTGKHVLWRFTRIGLFAIIAALVPVLFLSIQTYLLKLQNDRIDIQNGLVDLQNNLIEAQRRGSLIILMSNIMDQMNEEINIYKRDSIGRKKDITGYPLSQPLIGRISGLSQGFLPYKIYQDGVLSKKG